MPAAATARRCTTASALATSPLTTPDQGIPAKVVVVEPTGAETELVLEVGSDTLIVVLHGRTEVKPDDIVGLAIDGAKAHLFDTGSGLRIE